MIFVLEILGILTKHISYDFHEKSEILHQQVKVKYMS